MKIFIPLVLCLLGYFAQAQHTISGTFSPSKDYSWLIAYQLKPGTQVYVADTSIKDGEFVLKIPEKAEKGTYRLVYAVPQEEFYFDVIFNGKEDIELAFEIEEGPMFTASNENILFSTYFKEINAWQQQLIDYFASGKSNTRTIKEIAKGLSNTQNNYEEKSKNLMAYQFIKSNRPYIPSEDELIQDYVTNRKKEYFKHFDFSNPILQGSGFLTDKITNYAFTALPLEQISQSETEKAIQENIKTVSTKLEGIDNTYKFHLYYTLWAQAAASVFNNTSDFVYTKYLKELSESTKNQKIKDEIETHNRLRLGAKAPEITWKNGTLTENLTGLKGFENYIIVFWSSTCSHCLKELPELHKELNNAENAKVIAVGLEENEITWRLESEKLTNFEHAIALGKWESSYAKIYNIQATPTYFILDSDKNIIAKPESDKDVVRFLEK